jgi:hypothetical protein
MPNGRLKLILLLLAAAALAVLIAMHVDGINGPSYWRWPWRARRGPAPYLMLLAAAVPLLVAELRFSSRMAVAGILLMMATALGLEIVNRAADLETFDLTRVATIIEDPGSIGYFTHAGEFVQSGESVRAYLGEYVSKMPGFTLHARNKPPGSILFYVPFLKWSATENGAALAAGLCIALLATLSVPAVWWVTMELTGDRAAAYQAAACMALCPGLVLFLPEFDQFYPVYSCALIVLWAKALKTGRAIFAIAFGLLFAFVCFQTFNLLVLGVFLVGYAALVNFAESRRAGNRAGTARLCVVVIILTLIAAYALLWLWSGYNPIATLLTGIRLHQHDMPATHRTWPLTVPFDLTDFALGTGWVCELLAIYYLFGPARRDGRLGLTILCFAQLVAVALSGLLAGETARVWIFMFPLLLIPAGLELAAWRPGPRLAALACLWLLTALLSQNMVFV